ncbi:MAG: hypothetical protein F9K41_05680 [Sphingopyxis terrae]|nr:MAG: hypothetical protein F9K41_05680 [Sphingopyxis terrae]
MSRRYALSLCVLSLTLGNASAIECPRGKPIHIHHNANRNIAVYRFDDGGPAFYESKMSIDADGAPDAYHPKNSPKSGWGRDYLANAGFGRNCNVIVCKTEKHPEKGYFKTEEGPYAGYYVSASSLKDSSVEDRGDYRRYVDAARVPYVAIPGSAAKKMGAQTGDLAYVVNMNNGERSPAIFADIGTEKTLGEGSIGLAEALKFKNATAYEGGVSANVLFVVFPDTRSDPAWPRKIEDIEEKAEAAFEAWGGVGRVRACYPRAAKMDGEQ